MLLLFLPLIVAVKAVTAAEFPAALPNDIEHLHAAVPTFEIPKPVISPIYIGPYYLPTPPPTLPPTPPPTLPPTPPPTLPPTPPPTLPPTPPPTLPPTPPPTLPPTPPPTLPPTPRPTLPPAPRPLPHPQPRPLPRPTLRPIPDPKPEPIPIPTIPPRPLPTLPPTPMPPKPYTPNRIPDEEGIPVDYMCPQDGFYSVSNECDSYIECRNSKAWKYICNDGLLFDKYARHPEYPCKYPSEVQCEAGSSTRAAKPTAECPHQYGLFSLNDGECSRYLSCQEGNATIMNCPPGLVFNNQRGACDWPGNVPECSPSVLRGYTCPAADDDVIYRNRYGRSCSQYVTCERGYPRLLRCDPGLAFDQDLERCVDAVYVHNCDEERLYY